MSTQITTAFVQQYSSTLYSLVQQKGSRLRPFVRVEPVNGEYAYFDQVGATAAVERTTRHADTPIVNTPHSRRQVAMRDFEWADLIDQLDKVRLLADPTSTYMQAAMWALGRSIDDVLIEAALGTAKTGKTGSTSTTFPSGQQVTSGSVGLTIGKLRSAKELLDAAETDPDEPRFAWVSAKQVTNLLSTTEVTSEDYNSVKALVEGRVDTFMGFKFTRTQRLKTNGSSERRCIFGVQSGLLLGMGSEITGDIGPRRDKSNATQVYAKLSCGAVRMEEEKIVEVPCAE